ncbi:FGGY-family carbohydrate kinase [Microtetraspora malaysiensis]|uniref:FGGY-family carbohydrate kinase n=1 Tax=Microtetraspora malaysiensis TaxID=161358 RepID=UPI000A021ED4|nr:FGGY-family carbohydrate kinase [Microtetraspora malaysiensis]
MSAHRPGSPLLLGVDAGTTVLKAVVFDRSGAEVARASARLRAETPAPRHVERDLAALRSAFDAVLGEIAALVPPEEVVAVGLTGHGDGLYLVDADGVPTRPGVLSLDSRAQPLLDRWERDGTAERAFAASGQRPWAPSPATVLAWLAEHEPDVVARTAAVIGCKDLLKAWLTGEVSTDPTEASQSFTDPYTQTWSDAVVDAYGLGRWRHLLPPIVNSHEVAGAVTADAARRTGLRAGTPVVSGLHDVDACALATGVHRPGTLSVVAGSYSINQVVSDAPAPSRSWYNRSFVEPGHWLNMALSPASATNLEWFVQSLCGAELREAGQADEVFTRLSHEVDAVLDGPSEVTYLPFLYGSPEGAAASAGFVGLRGWHTRGHLVRALYEGVVHNHRWHADALCSHFTVDAARISGGATRSATWLQMFADGLGLPVTTTSAREVGALGAAMVAGVGAGMYADLPEAVAATVRELETYVPEEAGRRRMTDAYERFRLIVDGAKTTWG